MGYHHGGSSFHYPLETLLQDSLGPRVHAGRGLIQDKDQRVMEDSPGESQELPLTLTQISAPLPDRMTVAVRPARG